jgi:hypothetical protein
MHRPKERWRVKTRCRWQKEVWHHGYEQLCLRLHVRKLVHDQLRTSQLCRQIPARIPIWHLWWLPRRWLPRFGQQRRAPGRVRYSVRSVPFPSFTSSRSDIRYPTAIHPCTILFLHALFLCRNYSALYPSANWRPSRLVSIQGIVDFRRRSPGSFFVPLDFSHLLCQCNTLKGKSQIISTQSGRKIAGAVSSGAACSLTTAAPPPSETEADNAAFPPLVASYCRPCPIFQVASRELVWKSTRKGIVRGAASSRDGEAFSMPAGEGSEADGKRGGERVGRRIRQRPTRLVRPRVDAHLGVRPSSREIRLEEGTNRSSEPAGR